MANQAESKLTIEGLLAELTKVQAENAVLKAQQNAGRNIGAKIDPDNPASKIVRADHPEPGGGYVVRTPRDFTGQRNGIHFRGGIGIINGDHPDCDKLAHVFEHDYHYEIAVGSAEELLRVRRVMEGMPPPAQKTTPEKLMHAGKMGG
jgi:hypothetical protein